MYICVHAINIENGGNIVLQAEGGRGRERERESYRRR